jgi:hypothetical protein
LPRVSLDHPTFSGRLKNPRVHSGYKKRPVQPVIPRSIEGIEYPNYQPAKPQASMLPKDNFSARYVPEEVLPEPKINKDKRLKLPAQKTQLLFMAMAIGLFSLGLWLAYGGFKTTQQVKADIPTSSTEAGGEGTDSNPS